MSNPGRVALLAQEPAHHEPGADEKDHRQRDLGDEQQAAAAPAAAARAASAFLEHLVQVHARGPQRGHQPEQQAREDRDGERKTQHPRIDRRVPQQFREVTRHDQREQARAPERQRQAEAAAGERQQHVLGEELLQQPSAARARGGAQRHLLLPRGAGRQEQVRHVRAGDEQHEADGSEQERQAVRRAAEERLVQRHDARGGGTGLLAAPFEHLARDRRRFGLRRLNRHTRLEPPDRDHPARLGNLAQIVRGPERDLVFPRHQREVTRHDADDRPRLAIHVDRPSR